MVYALSFPACQPAGATCQGHASMRGPKVGDPSSLRCRVQGQSSGRFEEVCRMLLLKGSQCHIEYLVIYSTHGAEFENIGLLSRTQT